MKHSSFTYHNHDILKKIKRIMQSHFDVCCKRKTVTCSFVYLVTQDQIIKQIPKRLRHTTLVIKLQGIFAGIKT